MAESTRSIARAEGKTRYHGRPCAKGHGTLRLTANTRCEVCARQERAAYHAANKDRISKRHREWRSLNKDKISSRMAERYRKKRDSLLLKAKEHYQNNREHIKARVSKYRRENAEAAAAAVRRHYAANKGKYRDYGRARKARVRGAAGTFKQQDLVRILAKQDWRCAYCSSNLKKVVKHLDHIIPISLGGSNLPRNLQYLCRPCNLKKGSKDPITFARETGRLV